ncbi:protein WVD2-like 5 isoform X2 [Magnolia sinica]|uniref:protein WVD2-like 5 isoform X2 n=1 Tax=Magnolia sinica TaxID=86752 RepID=UPI00265A38EB|nr:protein WVD2-like 5 isoform X2 [Magnolia sinica]
MDADGLVNESDDANGVLEKLPLPSREGLDLDEVNGTLGNSIEVVQTNISLESTPAQSSLGEIEVKPIVCKESFRRASKKGEGKIRNSYTTSEKPLSTGHAGATSVKKDKDGKQVGATSSVSNGSLTVTSRSKQPFALASNRGSINAKPAFEGNESVDSGSPTRSMSAASTSLHFKPSERSGSATSTTKALQPDGLKEELNELKPLNQRPHGKGEEHSRSTSSSPTAAGSKPRRAGMMPTYNFSFKCDERAEKRKEFFTKLEEKTHAKEVEKTTLQAKSKETQEAEIKMLRKSLTFKATPMPSFYQEPAPPKVELKKIPTTRAKSPKLGRQKSLSLPGAEGSSNPSCRPARLSLDERVSRTGPTKESSPHVKKPLRKSLPKLLSERSTLGNPGSRKTDLPKNPLHIASEAPSAAEMSQTESKQDGPAAAEEQEEHTNQERVIEAISSVPCVEGC